MTTDEIFRQRGYERISLDITADLDNVTHHGIDGVYYNPDGHPPYIIAEAKYGGSRLSYLKDGTKQMESKWIGDRLVDALGEEQARVITKEIKQGNVGTQNEDYFYRLQQFYQLNLEEDISFTPNVKKEYLKDHYRDLVREYEKLFKIGYSIGDDSNDLFDYYKGTLIYLDRVANEGVPFYRAVDVFALGVLYSERKAEFIDVLKSIYEQLTHTDQVKKEFILEDGFETRAKDFSKAGKSGPENTWHHHQNGKTLQLVDRKIHRRFTHRGGISIKINGGK
ncbi:HNH endonuclease [Streptococcus suis]|nr:HNH endonuclease [Streptococcus suis]